MRRLLLISWMVFSSICALRAQNKMVLVVDAGHGGSDPGHLSGNAQHLPEKDLNLAIAKLVGGYINQYLTNIEVVYTRSDDSFVSLDDRVNKANTIGANYFISIHCNANERKHIHGTESHINDFKSEKAVSLAKEIEDQFSHRAGRHSRGIKDNDDREHSLQVLKYTKMTGVLVECGFLTNEKEASYLNTTSGQEIIASALFRAIRSFLQKQHPSICFIKDQNTKETAPVASTTTTQKETVKEKVTEEVTETKKYTIQLMSSKTPMDTKKTEFTSLGMDVSRINLNTTGSYKYMYTAGTFETKEEAEQILAKVRKKGFKDAIIIKKTT